MPRPIVQFANCFTDYRCPCKNNAEVLEKIAPAIRERLTEAGNPAHQQ